MAIALADNFYAAVPSSRSEKPPQTLDTLLGKVERLQYREANNVSVVPRVM